MWENASPASPPQSSIERRGQPRGGNGEQLLLWAQILLCVAVLGIVLAARTWDWAILPELRVAFEQAMRPEQDLFLSQQRHFVKFTERAVSAAGEAADGILSQFLPGATAETARRAPHSKAETVPAGARNSGYLPDFALTFPLSGGVCTRTSGYGWRADPMGGQGSDFHLGSDLAAAQGTPVLAAAGGVVRYAGVHDSYGNYVRLVHDGGDETLYAHMQYLFVRTGQAVSAGQVLGTVGETGNATGPHLHFEILHKGIRYDPSEALRAAS